MMKLRKPGPAWASDIYVGLDQARDKIIFATAVRIVMRVEPVFVLPGYRLERKRLACSFLVRFELIVSETLALQSERRAFRSL